MEKIPPEVLLNAYTKGVFPMAENGEIYWFAPKMRGVIPLDQRFHVPKSLNKVLRKRRFQLRMNSSFSEVVKACADREETWIDDVILHSYLELFELGFAHSVEVWDEEGLQGGLYGVCLGKAFFGESMFSRKTDASKIALVYLVNWMRSNDFKLLDTQWMTEHLKRFGGYEIPQEEYLGLLKQALIS